VAQPRRDAERGNEEKMRVF